MSHLVINFFVAPLSVVDGFPEVLLPFLHLPDLLLGPADHLSVPGSSHVYACIMYVRLCIMYVHCRKIEGMSPIQFSLQSMVIGRAGEPANFLSELRLLTFFSSGSGSGS